MNLSYWEYKTWLSNLDAVIIGSGIVGLTCAIAYKKKHPSKKVLILERGLLPQGASTKNAGFACFGSVSELLDDLNTHTEEEVIELVQQRFEGIQHLRAYLGDQVLDYQPWGGYELFQEKDKELFESCLDRFRGINALLKPVFGEAIFSIQQNEFGFKNVLPQYMFNAAEGQLDTGKMMQALLQKAQQLGIIILNGISVTDFEDSGSQVTIKTEQFECTAQHLFIATNGFAAQLGLETVKPARAQVLITKPIDNLNIQGTFHLDKGYYYFRNIDHRILLGGGRNLDFKAEETTELSQTALVQHTFEELLATVILPDQKYQIDHRWSGIMGVGAQKKPVIKQLSNHVFCGVRLGGMGVAIGSSVGKKLCELAT
ncbi:FAD-dependent oxidoreductase [Gangjinia marincola]|uniref:FAD-dependent oxidoreductase n=1 Tax=Gangjinia marincola TaxID=578463 RepID=A0ABP3XTG4_9FLAO